MWSDRDKLNEWIQVGIWYDVSEATVNAFVPIRVDAIVVVYGCMEGFARMPLRTVDVLVLLHESTYRMMQLSQYTHGSHDSQWCVRLIVCMKQQLLLRRPTNIHLKTFTVQWQLSDRCQQIIFEFRRTLYLFPIFNCPKAGNTVTHHKYPFHLYLNESFLFRFFIYWIIYNFFVHWMRPFEEEKKTSPNCLMLKVYEDNESSL